MAKNKKNKQKETLANPSKNTDKKEKQKKKTILFVLHTNAIKENILKVFKGEGLNIIVQFSKDLELSPCDSHIAF